MVIFKDRVDAGEKLGTLLKGRYKNTAVVSLLRGGVVVGHEVAKILKATHYPLPVAKIPFPIQPELAIGALCFDNTYLDKRIVDLLKLDKNSIIPQIESARLKFKSYLERFSIKKSMYQGLKGKTVILVDDGVATGATVKAAYLFLKKMGPERVVVATPVAPENFSTRGFDELVIFHKAVEMSSISRFYNEFPQLEDEEIKKILLQ